MASSNTTSLSLVDELRAEGRRRGLDSAQIEDALQRAGYSNVAAGGGGFGRMLGLAGRGAMEGLGGLSDINPFTAPQRLGNQLLGTPQPPVGPTTADQLGLPTPETPGERIGVQAASAAATALPIGMPLGGTLLRGAANTAIGAGAGAAGQTAREQGVGQIGSLMASLAAGVGVPALARLGPMAIRAAIRGTGERAEAARQAAALLQAGNPNAPLSMGQVTSGGLLGGARSAEMMIRNAPGAGSKLYHAYEKQAAHMGSRADALATRLGPGGDPTSAGRAVQQGVKEGFLPTFRATSDMLYQRVWSMVPGTTKVQPANVVNVFIRQGNLAASARPFSDNLAHPVLTKWADDLAATLGQSPQGIPLDVLKAWRSRLGEWLHGADLVEGMTLGDVRTLYGAVSDDIATAIKATNNPLAIKAWTRAQDYYRAGSQRIEDVLQPIMDKRTPELAFNAVMSGSKDGATILRSTMKSVPLAARRTVASTVLRNLGKAKPYGQDDLSEVFSPEVFLSRWNQLAAPSRAALFEGIDPQFTRDLNALAKSISVRREATRSGLPNPSGTASHTAAWSVLAALSAAGTGALMGSSRAAVAAGGSAMGAMATGNLAARALTSPRVVNWLVRQTKRPYGALAQEMAILAKQSEAWAPEDQSIAQEMVQTLGDMDWRSILSARAISDATSQGDRGIGALSPMMTDSPGVQIRRLP